MTKTHKLMDEAAEVVGLIPSDQFVRPEINLDGPPGPVPSEAVDEDNSINKNIKFMQERNVHPPNVPSSENLIIISLLMRLYDLNMALLNESNRAVADRVYSAHMNGETFNPKMYIPEFTDEI